YKIFILLFTFLCYASYHLSRKPFSVVKNVLHRNCSKMHVDAGITVPVNDSTWCDWAPFDEGDYATMFGNLDVAFLSAYAVGMFFSGMLAERINLRVYLGVGMILVGVATCMFGGGYFFNMHRYEFYVTAQVFGGLFQSTGWPGVVAVMGNWFGKNHRGLIMGLWNSHTSVGNILGSVIPGVFAEHQWGWSFMVPGMIIGGLGFITFIVLVPRPSDVGCESPDHHGRTGSARGSYEEIGPADSSASDGISESRPLLRSKEEPMTDEAISIWRAARLPGVLEFSLCLFFAKLVSYTFLFWLPKYIGATTNYGAEESADLSSLFDVGGIIGGVMAGVISDKTGCHGIVCVVMLIVACPMLIVYHTYATVSYGINILLLILCGMMVNGPYALITTAVSADLGTQKALRGNQKGLATVTAIIDGTGSVGAALGPWLTGLISPTGWDNVFYMLIGADICAALLLSRVFIREARRMCRSTLVVEERDISVGKTVNIDRVDVVNEN
ncbi:hypothetical protein BaRGS_00019902, partial [Batillaria attramentaria]